MKGTKSPDGRWVWDGTNWIPISSENTEPKINENKDITLFTQAVYRWARGIKSFSQPSPKLKKGQKTKFQLQVEKGNAYISGNDHPQIIMITDAGISVYQIGLQNKLKIAMVFSINTSSTSTELVFTLKWRDVLNIYPQKPCGFVVETKSFYFSIRAQDLSSEIVRKLKLKEEIIENYNDNGIPFNKKFLESPDYTSGFDQKFKEIFAKYKSNGSMSSLGLAIQRNCLTHGVEKLHFRGQFYCKSCDGENYKLIAEDYMSKILEEEII